MSKIPLVTDLFEFYARTPEGLPIWRAKGIQLTSENLLENVFVLSMDIAQFFTIRHNNLLRNIRKLQNEKQLPDWLLKVEQPYKSGKSTKLTYTVYALTRHQTYHLLMDFAGPKARAKKHEIVNRLESIETDVLKGAYQEARQKACTWDGVLLLKDLGFTCSMPNNIATKKDITTFLKIPESTLNNFLRKYSEEIKPIPLDFEIIQSIGSRARHMNGYTLEDVTKITLGMDTEVGIEAKRKILGNIGAFFKTQIKDEIQWRQVLSIVFAGFDIRYNYPVGTYRVDFFIPHFMLALECNGYTHRYYNDAEEKERERVILQKYALVRFHHKISLERLFNGILQAKPGTVIRLDDLNVGQENSSFVDSSRPIL